MTVNCQNCTSPYELPSGQEGKMGCPICKYINLPKAVLFEGTQDEVQSEEETQEAPAKTMLYYPDASQKDDPITAIQRVTQGKKPTLPTHHQISLCIQDGNPGESQLPLSKNEIILGRDKRCDIVLRDPEVSAHHCAIIMYETVALLKDLGSTNGTVLNGSLVKEDILKDGDKIQVGNTTLQFSIKPK
jgi:pSer/pThr/pTyr-binding forkhead associated (FHA) protein